MKRSRIAPKVEPQDVRLEPVTGDSRYELRILLSRFALALPPVSPKRK